ncbi:AraC family transcriptional regulator [Mycobacterium sp. 236(2023)]|uniref:helix-turn-helix transcriptional regulator n=1 Tax=Mycobacterium sp. 236(2023) TaxID=3038163 RepID=UPI0024151CE8|nr:AraC family transcriptional regulator [Mycobacterium sp. 236(2023)]MDG4663623.1 AraC family transcriptional regulator [Mycobacterium sp. 236(2023)]
MEELMALLRPEAVLSKVITGGGQWSVRKPRYGDPAFCLMLEGTCVLDADGLEALELRQGDFLLLPAMPEFTLSGTRDVAPVFTALDPARHTRHGQVSEPVTMRMLGGYFRFDPANAALLVALLPPVVHVRSDEPGAARLSRLVELIAEEADGDGAARDVILQRLVEVLLIEAARLHADLDLGGAQRGLIAGLTDPVLAPALRALHADVSRGWTVEGLARVAAVSRAVFAQRFTRTMGMPPMQYLLEWRVALAKDVLRAEQLSVAAVAQRVGYQSANAFTTAFIRVAGCSPTEFARSHRRDVALAGRDGAVQ